MTIRCFLLFIGFLISLKSFSQPNHYRHFFQEIDSMVQNEETLHRLQKLNQTKKLNSTEKLEFFKRIIPIAVKLQKFDLSLNYAFQGEKLAKLKGLDSLRALFINQIGGSYYYIRKRKEAIRYFRKANQLATQKGYWELEAKTSSNLGAMAIEDRDFKLAEQYLKKSIQIFKKHNIHHQDGLLTYRLLATLYNDTGQLNRAKALFEEIVSLSQDGGDTIMMTTCMTYYAEFLLEYENFDAGCKLIEKAIAIEREFGDKNALVSTLSLYGTQLQKNGRFKQAAELYREVINLNAGIFQDNLKNGIVEVEVQYKTAEMKRLKELAESRALAEQRKKNQYLFVSIGVLLILVIIFLLIYLKQQNKRRQFEAALQKMHLEGIIQAQEEEKVRIARDLHDGICQKFAATKMKFSSISKDLLDHLPEMESSYSACVNLLDEATNELREIAHEIMPPALNELGLNEALKLLTEQSFGNQLQFTYEVFGKVETMDANTNINIYRIAQELFANVLKHSAATEVSVQLLYSAKQLILHVEDNGQGFSPNKNPGMGLGNIKLRSEIIQAKFNIEPGANGGTVASLIVNKSI